MISFIGGDNISIHERAASCKNVPIVDHTVDTALEYDTASVSNTKNSCSRIIEDKKSSSPTNSALNIEDKKGIEDIALQDHLALQE